MASSGEDGDIWEPTGITICYLDTNEPTESQSQNVCSSNTSTEKECNDYGAEIGQSSVTDVSSDTTKDKIEECQDESAMAQSVVTASFYAFKDVEKEELEDNVDEIRMLIAGIRGVGKSSLANSIAGEHKQASRRDFETVTKNSAMLKCKRQEFSLIYFDTPDLSFNVDEERAQKEYRKCLIRAAPGLQAILIVQKATVFTKDNQAFLDTCTKLFGKNCWKYVIFVFTHIDELKRDLKDELEYADESLKHWLSKCGNRYVGINNNLKGTRNDQQIKILLSTIKNLMKTNNGEMYTNEDFQKIYQKIENAVRDGNLTLSEVREKFCKGLMKEFFNVHVHL